MILFFHIFEGFLSLVNRCYSLLYQVKGCIFSCWEVSIWRVDASLLSPSASPLRNARRCWRGNGPPPSQQGVPDGAGLSYSWPMAYRSPTSPLQSGLAVALSTNGRSGFWSRGSMAWSTSLAVAIIACHVSCPSWGCTTLVRNATPQTKWSVVEGCKFSQ